MIEKLILHRPAHYVAGTLRPVDYASIESEKLDQNFLPVSVEDSSEDNFPWIDLMRVLRRELRTQLKRCFPSIIVRNEHQDP